MDALLNQELQMYTFVPMSKEINKGCFPSVEDRQEQNSASEQLTRQQMSLDTVSMDTGWAEAKKTGWGWSGIVHNHMSAMTCLELAAHAWKHMMPWWLYYLSLLHALDPLWHWLTWSHWLTCHREIASKSLGKGERAKEREGGWEK